MQLMLLTRSIFRTTISILAFIFFTTFARAADVDIIVVLDNTSTMTEEAAFLTSALNPLVGTVTGAGHDVHLIAISADASDTEGICVPLPLGSGGCPLDQSLPGYRHVVQHISSTDALFKILDVYPQFSSSLRAGSWRHILVVSDDDSAMPAADFTSQLMALDSDFTGFTFHAIAVEALLPTDFTPPFHICDEIFGEVGGVGEVYLDLISFTGGIFGDLCDQDFHPTMVQIANIILDADGDGVPNEDDFYPFIPLGGLTDTDNDGAPDECDQQCIDDGMLADIDDDGDGIMDSLDREPLVPSNLCMGDEAFLFSQMVTTQETCAANISIVVESTVMVDVTGDLELISPSVELQAGFSVAGKLSVISTTPLPLIE